MQIIEFLENQKEEYNRFVMENETGSFLQSWEWGDWQSALGRMVIKLKLKVESGETVGVMQLIKMPLPLGKWYLYAPYGPVLDLRFKIEDLRFLIQELKNKFPNAVFIRIEPKRVFNFQLPAFSSPIYKSANIQPGKTLVIDLTKTEDQLLSEMHHKTRYNIKVAQKHGVGIQDEFTITNGHGLFFDEALQLISNTSIRQGFKTYTSEYYKKMVDFFTLHNREQVKLHIYKAVYQNSVLATAFMVDFGFTRTFLFGGSSENYKNVMAPYLLHWKAMQDAKALGLTKYDFWGIETSSGATPGFVRFKLGFAPQLDSGSARGEKEYGGGHDVVINALLYKLYLVIRKINKIIR